MSVAIDSLNERIELFEAVFDRGREGERTAVSRLFNRHLGPIETIVLHRPEAADFSMFTSAAKHCAVSTFFPHVVDQPQNSDSVLVPGGGKGAEPLQALLGGLGEMSERLLGMLHFHVAKSRGILYGSCAELIARGLNPLRPEELPLFAPQQMASRGFPYGAFTMDARLGWIAGTDLASGEEVLAPAQVILLYYRRARDEAAIGYPTTGGLAFHSSFERAVLHGMYEVIERDAINACWHSHIPPRRIRVDLGAALAAAGAPPRTRLTVAGIDSIELLLNTLDVPIPVITCFAVDGSRREKAFLSGGGAWGTRGRALTQSLFELGQCRNILKYHRPVHGKHILADSPQHELTEFFDSVVYYGFQENLPLLDWYRRDGETIAWEEVPDHPFDDPQAELRSMVERLSALGIRPLAFDLSGACWPGVRVVKTLLPQLTQAGVPSAPFLGHPRYYDLPKKLGLSDRTLTYEELNHTPVPLP